MKKLFIFLSISLLSIKGSAQDLMIKNINIIPMNSNTVLLNKTVVIKDGKIASISDFKNVSRNNKITIIDGKGKFLMPGLVDMHVHLPEENKIEKLLLSNVAAGITQIRVMNSVVPQTELKKKLSAQQLISPNIHFSHLIDRKVKLSSMQADNLMLDLKKNKISFIKLLSLSNEETFDHLTKAAHEHHIIVCGHYPVYQKDGKPTMVGMGKVLSSHYKSIEHLAGYTTITDEASLDLAIKKTVENNIYNCPTLDWDIMAFNLKYPTDYKNRFTYQVLPKNITKDWQTKYDLTIEKLGGSEKILANQSKYKEQYQSKLKILKKLNESGGLLLIGGDPSSDFQADGFNIYEEMLNWKEAGIDNFTILKSATITPALFFNEQKSWGTLEVGKNADLIILSKNPLLDIKNIATIEKTMLNGKVYENQTLMKAL